MPLVMKLQEVFMKLCRIETSVAISRGHIVGRNKYVLCLVLSTFFWRELLQRSRYPFLSSWVVKLLMWKMLDPDFPCSAGGDAMEQRDSKRPSFTPSEQMAASESKRTVLRGSRGPVEAKQWTQSK